MLPLWTCLLQYTCYSYCSSASRPSANGPQCRTCSLRLRKGGVEGAFHHTTPRGEERVRVPLGAMYLEEGTSLTNPIAVAIMSMITIKPTAS